MNKSETLIKNISNMFSIWETNVNRLGVINLNDSKVLSEDVCKEILNIVFGFSLENLNTSTRNQKCIDLGDRENDFSVQVTATNSRKKIQETIDCFVTHQSQIEFSQLKIFIVGKSKKYQGEFRRQEVISFSKRDIIDLYNIMPVIQSLPLKRQIKLSSYLNNQFSLKSIDYKVNKTNKNAYVIKKRIANKKKIKKLLFKKNMSIEDRKYLRYRPDYKFKETEFIIRNVNDESFPEVRENYDLKMSQWLKLEIFNDYNDGLEFIIGFGESIVFNKKGEWSVISYEDKRRVKGGKIYAGFAIGRIPYEYVEVYDEEGDDYYGLPNIFVRYESVDGTPYDEIVYVILGSEKDSRMTNYLDMSKRITKDAMGFPE